MCHIMEIKLEQIFHFSPLPVYKFPSETGPKLAPKENRLYEISHKRLIIFAPQQGLEPMRASRNALWNRNFHLKSVTVDAKANPDDHIRLGRWPNKFGIKLSMLLDFIMKS